ncbi:pinopsin-like [Diachasma alloeum]|uniref:pinopsin-like n=1 Tax=Diachasma alloeum TaxID=454923 RepID=UPI00073818AA|nr:pinopsin-like [Diachasma alloeum]
MDSEISMPKSLSSEAATGVAVILSAIGFCGFTFNLLVVIIIISDSHHLWTPVNVILWNLAFGDFLVALLGNPLALVSAVKGGWYWSHSTCLWYAWIMSTLGFASIGNLTMMALERYLFVVRPMFSVSIKTAMVLSGIVWVYAVSLSLPPFFGWGSYGYEPGNVSCSVSWEVHNPATHSDTYIAFLFFFGMIVPVILISASYFGIISTLKKVKKRTGGTRRREVKVTKMVALMITAFLIAWTPYAILALAAQYFYFQPSPLLGVLPSLLAKSSICYNPIIYAGLNAQFSQSVKKLLGIKEVRGSRSKAAMSSQTTGIVLTTRIERN